MKKILNVAVLSLLLTMILSTTSIFATETVDTTKRVFSGNLNTTEVYQREMDAQFIKTVRFAQPNNSGVACGAYYYRSYNSDGSPNVATRGYCQSYVKNIMKVYIPRSVVNNNPTDYVSTDAYLYFDNAIDWYQIYWGKVLANKTAPVLVTCKVASKQYYIGNSSTSSYDPCRLFAKKQDTISVFDKFTWNKDGLRNFAYNNMGLRSFFQDSMHADLDKTISANDISQGWDFKCDGVEVSRRNDRTDSYDRYYEFHTKAEDVAPVGAVDVNYKQITYNVLDSNDVLLLDNLILDNCTFSGSLQPSRKITIDGGVYKGQPAFNSTNCVLLPGTQFVDSNSAVSVYTIDRKKYKVTTSTTSSTTNSVVEYISPPMVVDEETFSSAVTKAMDSVDWTKLGQAITVCYYC